MKIDYDRLKRYFKPLMLGMYYGTTYLQYTARIIKESGEERERSVNTIGYLDPRESHVCFGSLLNNIGSLKQGTKEGDRFKIQLFVPKDCSGKNKIATWMNPEELREFILDFVNLFSNRLNVLTIDVTDGIGQLTVNIVVDREITYLEEKLLLFWTRNAIKWPYNLLVASAFTLKNDYYPEDTLYNLLSVVIYGTKFYSDYTATLDENWSCWGPFISPEYLDKKKSGKQYILGLSHGGLLPHISYEEYTRETRLDYKEIRETLNKDVLFRKSKIEQLVSLRGNDEKSESYKPIEYLDNKSQFLLYQEIYDFKHTLKPL